VHDNTVAQNGRDGILISSISTATVDGGVITQNGGDGIRVGGEEGFLMLPGQSTATIGLDSSSVLEISQNSGVGITVEDDGFDSEAIFHVPTLRRGQGLPTVRSPSPISSWGAGIGLPFTCTIRDGRSARNGSWARVESPEEVDFRHMRCELYSENTPAALRPKPVDHGRCG
jgi:hypothetical protein